MSLAATVEFAKPGEGRFDLDIAIGHDAEGYVADILRHASYVEVKRDASAAATGNLYVEYQCRWKDGLWHASGVASSAADFFRLRRPRRHGHLHPH